MKTTVSQLRLLVAATFPEAMQTVFARDMSPLNHVMELRPGKLVEVVSRSPNSGAGLVLLNLCEKASGPVAWVDGEDALDPVFLSPESRNRVLWLRCQGVKHAMKAADMLLRDGNLQTVLLDLRMVPERQLYGLPSSIWHRLRMLAEKSHASVAVFSSHKSVTCASARWVLESGFDLASLQQQRTELASALHPLSARGLYEATVSTGPSLLS